MRIAVFGATGKTGRHIVEQALNAGHVVTALARTPGKLNIAHDRLSVVQGDLANPDAIARVVSGADAVISVLGPTNNKPERTISAGMRLILDAMRAHNVKRLIISAGAGVRDPLDKPKLIDRFFGLVLRLVSANVVADMEETVALVRASDRDWTVVRVPMLTDAPPTGSIKVGYVGDISPRISRADMAAFMLKQIEDKTYVGKAPAISN